MLDYVYRYLLNINVGRVYISDMIKYIVFFLLCVWCVCVWYRIHYRRSDNEFYEWMKCLLACIIYSFFVFLFPFKKLLWMNKIYEWKMCRYIYLHICYTYTIYTVPCCTIWICWMLYRIMIKSKSIIKTYTQRDFSLVNKNSLCV